MKRAVCASSQLPIAPWVLYFHSPTPIPSILHTNRESRLQSRTLYTEAFIHPRYTYVNFSTDKLFIDSDTLRYILPSERAQIRKVRLEIGEYDEDCFFLKIMPEDMKDMPLLEELDLVAWTSDYSWHENDSHSFTSVNGLARVWRWLERYSDGSEGWVFPVLRLVQSGITLEWKAGPLCPPVQT